jgi:hypothetical protein
MRAALAEAARRRPLLLELFVAANLGFLALDVWIAHSMNDFRVRIEWLPVFFSAAAAGLVAVGIAAGGAPQGRLARPLGTVVGWAALAVGIGGLLFHLESRFFQEQTLQSLVYSAPFAAPLAYAGLGLLLLMNRSVPAQTAAWGRWVLLLALGGFIGNFALCLADHAQNGFFRPVEWVSVAAAALAVGFLGTATFGRAGRRFLGLCAAVLAVEVLVGLLGFALHLAGGLGESGPPLADRIVFGPPAFAPLLFPNLALLAGLGLWHLRQTGGG